MRSLRPLLYLVPFVLLFAASSASAAPAVTYQPSVVPVAGSVYYLGTTSPSTKAWKSLITDQVCLTGDICRTTWPSAAGGSPVGSVGQLQYYGAGPAFAGVSTTTLTAGTNITFSGGTPVIVGSSPITINASGGAGGSGTVSTSTSETAGSLSYWTSTAGTPATLGKVATTTLSGTGVITISNSPVLIGASPAVASITGGANGQVLGWLSGAPTWTATSSVAAGTGVSVATAGAVNTVTNTGVISNSCPGGFLTCSGTNPSSFSLGTLGLANGGTATTTFYNKGLVYSDGAKLTQPTGSGVGILNWDNANGYLGVGSSTPFQPLSVTGGVWLNSQIVHAGQYVCNSSLASMGVQGFEYCGNDNTQNGTLIQVANNNNGANAFTGFITNTDISDSTVTHYGGLLQNSSGYSYAGFGNAINLPSQVQVISTDNILTLASGTSTPAKTAINFLVGGYNTSNEIGRFTTTGLGIGTTTPHATLAVNAASSSPQRNILEASYSTGAANNATTTVFSVASSTAASLLLGTSTPALGAASATSTIYMQKLQWQGGNSAGTTYCVFLNSTGALTTQSGPCL